MGKKYSISTVFKSTTDKFTKPVAKMQKGMSKFTLGAEAGLRRVDSALSGLSSGLFRIGKAGVLGAAGIGTAAIAASSLINKEQAELENMSKAMGASIQTVEAVASAVSGIGIEADAVTDLYEEMNNKFGESAGLEEITAVTESLDILGLSFENIKKLSPEEQFVKITDAALKMEDATKAQAAADILMGGEANKIIGTLRQQGKSMNDIIGNYEELSFRTEKSRAGALANAKSQSKMTKIIASLGKEMAGLVGTHLTPMIDKFNEFMIANKEIIGQSIDKLFKQIAESIGDVSVMFKGAVKWVQDLGANFDKVKSWASSVLNITAVVIGFIIALKSVIAVMTLINLVMAANPAVLIFLGIAAAVAVLAAAVAYVYSNWDEISVYFEGVWDSIKSAFNSGMEFVKLAFDWSPLGMIINNWGGITDYFTDLFGGVVDIYKSTIGSVMSGLESAKDFLGFGDDADLNVDKNSTTNHVVTPQERQSQLNSNVYGELDVRVQADAGLSAYPAYSPKLKLANTGN